MDYDSQGTDRPSRAERRQQQHLRRAGRVLATREPKNARAKRKKRRKASNKQRKITRGG